MSPDPVLDRLAADEDAALARLMELVRIPSISTDPDYGADVRRAADWLAADLCAIGATAGLVETEGHPMVLGEIGAGSPHLLFYGHYDVQPVDPLELWDRDPFDPAVEDTGSGPVLRGRGTSDDKGQVMTFLEALRAWVGVHGAPPCRITVFLEGEEESGSPSLVPFLERHRERLAAADIALICDTTLAGPDRPAICTQLRGLVGEEVTLRAATRDLHSGTYGGVAANPNRVLARILADLHDATGRVTLPGFYDGVPETPADVLAGWDSLGIGAAELLGEVGLSHPAGETGRSLLEMVWARPTAEINGMTGGYAGPGFKTVLPAEASAKVSFRLVGAQDPEAVRAAFRAHVADRLPPDVEARFADHGAGAASVMDTAHPAFTAARAALDAEWPHPSVFVGGGGSIPVAGLFQSHLGLNSVLMGFALDDDRIHSPNEKYDLRSFRKGARSWARFFAEIAG
ncbi:MAG: M20/M25/M40 family metallo-hydrolase [Paracoccaceae bacterium]|nr:M20/M25/M40 family metallo-hydrolase [Paracoccaceae bacterium]